MSLIRKGKKGLIWKVRKIKNTKKQNRFDKLLEMPKEISSTDPKVTIMGFNEMLIENYKGILEYQEFFVRISTHIGIVSDKRNSKGIPYLIHNTGQPFREEDALEQYSKYNPISGHYRMQ